LKQRKEPDDLSKWITSLDREQCATSNHLIELLEFLGTVRDKSVKRMLDVGCGYGGLTRALAEVFQATEVYGIEIDPSRQKEARSKGVIVHVLDAEIQRFPFEDEYFDLIVSFGMFEHLAYVDNLMQEANRVLSRGGLFIISTVNLGSWVNRLSLLLGYQPRDVEISRIVAVGTHPSHAKEWTGPLPAIDHVHAATTRAFQELMEFYGFRTIRLRGWKPQFAGLTSSVPFRIVDSILCKRVTLARRFFYLGIKDRDLKDTDYDS